MTFRIIKNLYGTERSDHTVEYIIEKKGWFGWTEVQRKEIDSKTIVHKTYEIAERYMIDTYMGHGRYKQIGCVYEYIEYTYFF